MLGIYLFGVLICLIWWALDLIFLQRINVFNVGDLVVALFIALFSWITVLALSLRLLVKVIFVLLDKAEKIILWKRKDNQKHIT